MVMTGVSILLAIWATLCALCYGAPVDPPQPGPVMLRASEFNDVISTGMWWIKFYSPYCPHCQHFAPTWNKIHKDLGSEGDPYDFHMASVNCVEEADLCGQEEVFSYPLLRLYKDGNATENFPYRQRDAELLEAYARAKMRGLEFTKPSPTKNAHKATKMKPNAAAANAAAATDTTEAPTAVSTTSTTTAATTTTTTAVGEEFHAPPPQIPPPQERPENVNVEGEQQEPLPNAAGTSIDIDANMMEQIVGSKQGWLIKYHSPYCPHCVKMKPIWDKVASGLREVINVGEVNCETMRGLCRKAGIEAYPTIRFVAGSLHHDFEGLREYADISAFARSAVNSGKLDNVHNQAELNDAISQSEHSSLSTYLFFYNEDTPQEYLDVASQLAVSLIGKGQVIKTQSEELASRFGVNSFPAFYALSDSSRWVRYTGQDMKDTPALMGWARENWLALAPQLTPTSASSVFEHSDYLVLAITNGEDPSLIQDLRTTALSYYGHGNTDSSIDRRPSVGFAWIDGSAHSEWLLYRYPSLAEVTKRPAVIIHHKTGRRYWDTDVTTLQAPIDVSSTSILSALESALTSPHQVPPKGVAHTFWGRIVNIEEHIRSHALISIAVVAALVLLLVKRRRLLSVPAPTLPTYRPIEGKMD